MPQPPDRRTLENWITNTAYPPDGDYHEDPLPSPTISVEEAYTLDLDLDTTLLCVYWAGPHESTEYPKAKRVIAIDFVSTQDGHNFFDIHTNTSLNGVLRGDERLEIHATHETEQLLYGLWLKLL